MIISHKHKFIFFKTRKTAGSSIQAALSQICDLEKDVITGSNIKHGKLDESHSAGVNVNRFFTNHPHPTLSQVRAFLGEEVWNSYYKFAFVRNPYDIVVSRYHWNLKGKQGGQKTSIEHFRKWVKAGKMLKEDSAHIYIESNGKVELDYVGRYENLEKDLEFVCKKLNLGSIELPKLKSGFRDKTSYTKFYDAETKNIIQEFYKKDFSLLNYGFDKRFILNKHKKPIITPNRHTGENINGPSLIKAPDFIKNKLGKYYLYFAHHAGKNIRLAYSDNLEGPWNILENGSLKLSQTTCKNHIASPDVHVRNGKIIMYFHGDHPQGQSTFAAESVDGINFEACTDPITPFYHREFEYLGETYAVCKNKNISSQIFKRKDNEYLPELELLPNSRHTAVFVDGKNLFIFYTIVGEAPERIYVLKINDWEVEDNYELAKPDLDFEGAKQPLTPSKFGMAHGFSNQLRDPCIFLDEDRLYLLYSYGGESGLAFGELV